MTLLDSVGKLVLPTPLVAVSGGASIKVANRRPSDQTELTIRRAIRDGLASGIEAGLADGLAHGLRRHVPGAVAILAKGIPLCAFSAFLHLVLGVDLPAIAIAAFLGAMGIGATKNLEVVREATAANRKRSQPPQVSDRDAIARQRT